MSRKHSYEPMNPKIQYQVTSPYIDLLGPKRKVYGHKFDMKNNRSFNNHVKPSPASASSLFVQGPKPFKSTDKRTKSRKPSSALKNSSHNYSQQYHPSACNEQKKRVRTETMDEIMHESLCVYPNSEEVDNPNGFPERTQTNESFEYNKSFNYGQLRSSLIADEKHRFQKSKNFKQKGHTTNNYNPHNEFLPPNPPSDAKKKRKRHLSQNKNLQKHYGEQQEPIHMDFMEGHAPGLEHLQIRDIDSLLQLIENCTNEANEYISYLSGKLESSKQELIIAQSQNVKFESWIKMQEEEIAKREQDIVRREQNLTRREEEISKRDQKIDRLERELRYLNTGARAQKEDTHEHSFQIKHLLTIIEKISDENQKLRSEVQSLNQAHQQHEADPKHWRPRNIKQMDVRSKQYYNSIHSKIDILNISIDSNQQRQEQDRVDHMGNECPQGSPQRNSYAGKEELSRKLKYIKPKSK